MTTTSSYRERVFLHGTAMLAACIVAAMILAPGIVGKDISPQAIACGGTRNTVQTELDLEQGSDIWREFPAMLRAPELEGDTGPVHLVVFKGDVDISGMLAGRPADVPPVADAICVVLGDGTLYFYDGVSRSGSKYQ